MIDTIKLVLCKIRNPRSKVWNVTLGDPARTVQMIKPRPYKS